MTEISIAEDSPLVGKRVLKSLVFKLKINATPLKIIRDRSLPTIAEVDVGEELKVPNLTVVARSVDLF